MPFMNYPTFHIKPTSSTRISACPCSLPSYTKELFHLKKKKNSYVTDHSFFKAKKLTANSLCDCGEFNNLLLNIFQWEQRFTHFSLFGPISKVKDADLRWLSYTTDLVQVLYLETISYFE